MKILGVDPGTWRTGVGVIEATGNRYKLLYFDTILIQGSIPIEARLGTIYRNLISVIEKFRPDVLALENIFYAKNIRSMVKIGEARACAMLAASQSSISVAEYPPAKVKQAVTGNGRASKQQIQAMVKALLGLKALAPSDPSDALAVAICHLHHQKDKLFLRNIEKSQKSFLTVGASAA